MMMEAVKDTRIFCQSWLEKQAEWRFSWRRRYFVLDGNRLAYRMEEDAQEKRFGTIFSLDCNAGGSGSSTTFRVWLLEGGCWSLRAESQEIYDRWVSCLLLVLKNSESIENNPSSLFAKGKQHERLLGNNAVERVGPQLPNTEDIHLSGQAAQSASAADFAATHGISEYNAEGCVTSLGTAAHSESTSASSSPCLGQCGRTNYGTPLIVGTVLKKGAWTGIWKSRVLELYESAQLVYRSTCTSAARRRYSIIAADPAIEGDLCLEVLFTVSTGERFWIRFPDPEVCCQWRIVLHDSLQKCASWHCLSIPEISHGDAGPTTWLASTDEAHPYYPLHVHYHCAALARIALTESSSHTFLFVFGGSRKWCRGQFYPQAQAFIPTAVPSALSNSLYSLQLAGTHAVHSVELQPFAEQPCAKVKPPALFGATLSVLYRNPPDATGPTASEMHISFSADAAAESGPAAVGLVLIGGTSGVPCYGAKSEIWCGILPQPCMGSAAFRQQYASPYWRRYQYDSDTFPQTSFHSAVVLQSAYSEGSAILVTGGLDESYLPRAECYRVAWHAASRSVVRIASTAADSWAQTPTVEYVGSLPAPRAFHHTALLSDGTVVLIGGRGVNDDPVEPLLTLPPTALNENSHGRVASPSEEHTTVFPWIGVHWLDGIPLPPLPDVAVSSTSAGDRIIALASVARPAHAIRLFVLSFQDNASTEHGRDQLDRITKGVRWTELALRVGAVPSRILGATIHIHNDYIYFLGGAQSDSDVSTDSYKLGGPLRILMDTRSFTV